MSRKHRHRDEVYAVIRFDPDLGEPEHQVTVKEVVRTREAAEAEVARLNRLNAAKGCRYFWQQTRLFSFDEADGPGG
jgi:hypothetical protein